MVKRQNIKCIMTCDNCGAELIMNRYNASRGKYHYCNRKCQDEHRVKAGLNKGENNGRWKGGLVTVYCEQCNKPKQVKAYKLNDNTYHFCDKECERSFKTTLTGEKAYNWRGGLNGLVNSIRKLTIIKEWTANILKRDGYKCSICGNVGKIQAHHIIGLTSIIRAFKITHIDQVRDCPILLDLDNGVTMCKSCHIAFHAKYGKYNFTPEDYREFSIANIKIVQ